MTTGAFFNQGFVKAMAALLWVSLLHAQELLHDNLSPFPKDVSSAIEIYRQAKTPRLFSLAIEDYERVYVRRDRVSPSVYFSVHGTDFDRLSRITFAEVSGTGEGPQNLGRFYIDPLWNLDRGINLAYASRFAEMSSVIYQKFPLASSRFKSMGFEEQYFFASLDEGVEGVTLKNKEAIVFVFRGTEPSSLNEWLSNARFLSLNINGKREGENLPKIHRGFYTSAIQAFPFVIEHVVSTLENRLRLAINTLAREVKKPENLAPGRKDFAREFLTKHGFQIDPMNPSKDLVLPPDLRPLYLTGHSRGAAMATVIYSLLLLAHRDPEELGYYFVDPTLRRLARIDKKSIDRLILGLVNEAGFGFLFNDAEKDAMGIANQAFGGKVLGLQMFPTIMGDALGAGLNRDTGDAYTMDRRLRMLTTFGSPRVGDWLFKYHVEKYASKAGSLIARFENLHKVDDPEVSLLGDLVTRLPIFEIGIQGFEWLNELLPQYTHLGYRIYFNSEHDEVGGNLNLLHCEYTNRKNEESLNAGLFKNFELGLSRHDIAVYLSRILSYLKTSEALRTGELPLPQTCSQVKYGPVDF